MIVCPRDFCSSSTDMSAGFLFSHLAVVFFLSGRIDLVLFINESRCWD